MTRCPICGRSPFRVIERVRATVMPGGVPSYVDDTNERYLYSRRRHYAVVECPNGHRMKGQPVTGDGDYDVFYGMQTEIP